MAMTRKLGGLVLLAALGGGCVQSQPGSFMSHVGPGGAPQCGPGGCGNGAYVPKAIPGVMGAWGAPIPMQGSMVASEQSHLTPAEQAARASFVANVPPDVAQKITYKQDQERGAGILQSGFTPGPCSGNLMQAGGPMPPSELVQASGPATALPFPVPPQSSGVPGSVAAIGALTGQPAPYPPMRTSVRFSSPNGMKVAWFAPSPSGKMEFTQTALDVPGRYNYLQGAIYRLKLSNIPGWSGPPLYPTLEVVRANNKTATFLAHSAVPLSFTRDDLDQVASGHYLVKVVYLPYPQFQDQAEPGLGEVVSTRLEPGADPVAEAQQRGSVLLIVRMGNIDLEAPNTPAMDAPGAGQQPPAVGPMGLPGGGPLVLPPNFGTGMGQPGMGMPNPGMMGMTRPGMPGQPGMPGGLLVPGAQPGAAPPVQPPQTKPTTGAAPAMDKDGVQPVGMSSTEEKTPEKKKPGWAMPWFKKNDEKK